MELKYSIKFNHTILFILTIFIFFKINLESFSESSESQKCSKFKFNYEISNQKYDSIIWSESVKTCTVHGVMTVSTSNLLLQEPLESRLPLFLDHIDN